jgi:hypothetical protein
MASSAEACGEHNMRIEKVDALAWESVKLLLTGQTKFVELLRERFATPDDGALLASAAGALKEAQEQVATLAATIGMTSSEVARQALVAQLETVSEQVVKLEAQYQEAQAIAQNEIATEAFITSVIDRIYGAQNSWIQRVGERIREGMEKASQPGYDMTTDDVLNGSALMPTDDELNAWDALPFDIKRLAVEASGVTVKVYPTGWRQEHEGATADAPRVTVSFNVADPFGLSKLTTTTGEGAARPA